MSREHASVVEAHTSTGRRERRCAAEGRNNASWAPPVIQLAVLPVVGALGLLMALAGPLLRLSVGAAGLGLVALAAPAAASFVLARRTGREPAAVAAWGTCCVQLALTIALSVG